nr:unnamed protein product [Spirometra erinaceieuropaei]
MTSENQKKLGMTQDTNELGVPEPMDTEVANFNSNMRVTDAVCPALPPNQLPQDMEVGKPFAVSETTLSDSLGIGKTGSSEAFAEECVSRSSGVLEYVFKNIEDPRKVDIRNEIRLLSDASMIRCLPWKILLVFPRPESRNAMGMFLQCNAESPSTTWTCYARASLELVSQNKRVNNKKLRIRHTFAHKENDWGYQTFIPYNDLFNPENGYVVNNTICARITVEADAPHGAEWDSKRFTGFVGLKNQGATCYLNSVLQALYCTNCLRSAVFRMPTESDDSLTSVPLALQRTFYELQTSAHAVCTEKLTRSFGWATWDSFMQHDAQELCRVLLDNIENKMKGTTVEDIIPNLFSGKMVSYIKCTQVNYESKREENFYDIQLKVNGNKDVHAAFKEYIQVEMLANDNKYDAGKYGLQEAEKGVKFIKFPPVLYLQLMRFQYDFHSNTNVKINDRFEFPYDLDLKDYVLDPAEAQYTDYFLHAVLVHSGDHHGGHYVVYINPLGDKEWYQFDDDVVSKCSSRDAIEMNYGNSEDPDIRAYTNAYMLVYIAKNAKEEVLCPVTERDIPPSLRSRFLEEQSVDEQKQKFKDSAHEFLTVNILLEEDFNGYEGPEIFRLDLLPVRSVRVRKDVDGKKLVKEVAKALEWDPATTRLWQVSQREKGSYLIEFNLPKLTEPCLSSTLIFWAQQVPANLTGTPLSLTASSPPASRLFFFKYFDPISCTLSFCGSLELNSTVPATYLPRVLRERAGLPPDTPLIFFREFVNRVIQAIEPASLLTPPSRSGIHGEVIFFQIDPGCPLLYNSCLVAEETGKDAASLIGSPHSPPITSTAVDYDASFIPGPLASSLLRKMSIKPSSPAGANGTLPSFADYYASRITQVEILLVDKLRKSDPGILLRLSPSLDYKGFANLVANYLSAQPDRLQFFTPQPISALNQAQQGLLGPMGNDSNTLSGVNLMGSGGSPVNSEAPGGNGNYSPTGASDLISVQSMAAKASGFSGASPQFISALASVTHQGLTREPPGPPIPSTVSGTLRDFLQLPAPAYPVQSQAGATNFALSNAAQDRPPQLLARYSGVSTTTTSPFGNLSFPAPRRVYYAHIALPIDQLEALKQVQVAFIGPRLCDRLDLSLSVPGNGTVADLLAEARPHVTLVGSGKLRLLEVRNNRIIKVYQNDFPLEKIESQLNRFTLDSSDNLKSGLRIEELPLDEVTPQPGEVIIYAAHFNKDLSDTFGVPFTVRIRDQEPYSAVKERIRKRLEVPDKEFDAWNFVLVTKSKPICIPSEQDILVDTEFFATSTTPQPWLGVEHKPYKRPRYAPSEKPIKIHN